MIPELPPQLYSKHLFTQADDAEKESEGDEQLLAELAGRTVAATKL